MPNSPKKILIAGAGIGGLSAAACLLRAGHDVQILEQAPELAEIGAGIGRPVVQRTTTYDRP